MSKMLSIKYKPGIRNMNASNLFDIEFLTLKYSNKNSTMEFTAVRIFVISIAF